MRTMLPGSSEGEDTSKHVARVRSRLESGKPVFLKNMGEPRGIIHLGFVKGNGRSSHLNFPDTYLPIDITAHAPHDALIQSSDLMHCISIGLLRPVPSKVARAMLDDEDAHEEISRLAQRMKTSTRETNAARTRGGTNPTMVATNGQAPNDLAAQRTARAEERESEELPDPVNARIQAIVARFQSNLITEGAALSELKSMDETLTREDLGYLVGNGAHPQDATKTRIVRWALKKMATLGAAYEAEAVKPTKAKKTKSGPPAKKRKMILDASGIRVPADAVGAQRKSKGR